jgi:hypothetical protein
MALPPVPAAGRPDGRNSERATEFVHNESSQRLALNIFRNYEQRLADVRDLLQERKQILPGADLLFVNEYVCVLEGNSMRSGSVMK